MSSLTRNFGKKKWNLITRKKRNVSLWKELGNYKISMWKPKIFT